MQPGRYNINIKQGSTLSFTFTISTDGTPWNLSTYTARMQVRSFASSSTKLLDLSSPTNISLSSLGTCTVTVSATDTAALPAGSHVYDIEFETSGNIVYPILEGKFIVTSEVTR